MKDKFCINSSLAPNLYVIISDNQPLELYKIDMT